MDASVDSVRAFEIYFFPAVPVGTSHAWFECFFMLTSLSSYA